MASNPRYVRKRKSRMSVPVLRDGFLALAYGSFTLTLFEGAESMWSAMAGWQRRG